jgi:hypothetical protein
VEVGGWGVVGGGYLIVNRGYPPFKKGVGLGNVHIGGIFFCYSKLLLYSAYFFAIDGIVHIGSIFFDIDIEGIVHIGGIFFLL